MEDDSLCDLQVLDKHDWKIKIRLARKWQSINNTTGQVLGMHLIFIDQYVSSFSCTFYILR